MKTQRFVWTTCLSTILAIGLSLTAFGQAAATKPATDAPAASDEFYLLGTITKPGVYPLNGKKITLKQALTTAGINLENARDVDITLIRRMEDNKESKVHMNLAAIFDGSETDRVLQADDVINVDDPRLLMALNLRGIAQSCNIYAADHKDQMPDHLARLVENGDVNARQFVGSRSGTVPLTFTNELAKLSQDDFPKFAQQIDAHCDLVYLGNGMKFTADATIVVAYEKPGTHTPKGITVAFQDGHAAFIPWASLEKTFEPTNAYLMKNGLPLVNVSALIRAGVPGADAGQIVPGGLWFRDTPQFQS